MQPQSVTLPTSSPPVRPTRLEFGLVESIGERELPVEVRRADLALITRSHSRDIVEVNPGEYYVSAWLPEGGELRGRVSIQAGQESVRVDLTPSLFPVSHRHARLALPEGASAVLLRGQLFAGSPLDDQPRFRPKIDQTGTFRLDDDPELSGPRMLCYRKPCPAGRVILWPIPDAAREHAAFQVVDEEIPLVPRLDHPQADLMLGYLQRGALAEAEISSRSVLISAEEMLRKKRWNPLAAALGAYLLLRHHALEGQVSDWAERLRTYNENLPDAYCINAEMLATRRAHDKALSELLKGLNNIGLPFFTEGLILAAGRLARYLRAEPEQVPWLDDDRRTEARLLLTRLDWLGAHRALGRPVLTLCGFDPSLPEQYESFWSIRPEL